LLILSITPVRSGSTSTGRSARFATWLHRHFSVDWAVVWKIAQEEPPILEEQALAIIRAEFPDLAQAYGLAAKPETEPDHCGDDPDA
jgi:hypothetical protein